MFLIFPKRSEIKKRKTYKTEIWDTISAAMLVREVTIEALWKWEEEQKTNILDGHILWLRCPFGFLGGWHSFFGVGQIVTLLYHPSSSSVIQCTPGSHGCKCILFEGCDVVGGFPPVNKCCPGFGFIGNGTRKINERTKNEITLPKSANICNIDQKWRRVRVPDAHCEGALSNRQASFGPFVQQ